MFEAVPQNLTYFADYARKQLYICHSFASRLPKLEQFDLAPKSATKSRSLLQGEHKIFTGGAHGAAGGGAPA